MASISPEPARITPGATVTMTLYGIGTSWLTSPPSLSATDLTFDTPTVSSDGIAQVSVTAGTTTMTTLLTDASSGASVAISIRRPTRWVPIRLA